MIDHLEHAVVLNAHKNRAAGALGAQSIVDQISDDALDRTAIALNKDGFVALLEFNSTITTEAEERIIRDDAPS